MAFSFSGLFEFLQETFSWSHRLRQITDRRRRPQIPLSQILNALFVGIWQGSSSLLALDQKMRLKPFKKLLGSTRSMVVSDSTLERILSFLDISQLRSLLFHCLPHAHSIGAFLTRLPSGRRLCVGHLDGSTFIGGTIQASVLRLSGSAGAFVDFEPFEGNKPGKELPASRALLKRYFHQTTLDPALPRPNLLLLDGLYASQEDINLILEQGVLPVIRTQEHSLSIVQDAEGIFSSPTLWGTDVSHRTGFDPQRKLSYEVWSCSGFSFPGVSVPFTVTKVHTVCLQEKDPSRREQTHYLLRPQHAFPSLALTPEDDRELLHQRWDIENQGFKALNAFAHSKHLFTHNPHAAHTLLWILFLAYNLFHLFCCIHDFSLEEPILRTAKKTKAFLQTLLGFSLFPQGEFDPPFCLATLFG